MLILIILDLSYRFERYLNQSKKKKKTLPGFKWKYTQVLQ